MSLNSRIDSHWLIPYEFNIKGSSLKPVVSAPEEIRELLPLLEKRYVLFSITGTSFFPMSNTEVLQRYVLDNFLQGRNTRLSLMDLKSIFHRHFINVEQKMRYETRIFPGIVEKRQSILDKQYNEYLLWGNQFATQLNDYEFLKLQIQEFDVGVIVSRNLPPTPILTLYECGTKFIKTEAIYICLPIT